MPFRDEFDGLVDHGAHGVVAPRYLAPVDLDDLEYIIYFVGNHVSGDLKRVDASLDTHLGRFCANISLATRPEREPVAVTVGAEGPPDVVDVNRVELQAVEHDVVQQLVLLDPNTSDALRLCAKTLR